MELKDLIENCIECGSTEIEDIDWDVVISKQSYHDEPEDKVNGVYWHCWHCEHNGYTGINEIDPDEKRDAQKIEVG